ncbi:dioxygenase family protein [Flavobacterium sp.]|uniref:dioxygenase family protein n=1 Tax=Flavobacterium sp. TaxID=239 RepID=UPI002FDEE3C4
MYSFFHKSTIVTLAFILFACQNHTNSQTPKRSVSETQNTIGGGCEGCELMYVGMPQTLTSVHQSIGWNQGHTRLIITGKVVQIDGKTPAPNVVIYYWHTNDEGLYEANAQTPKKALVHGRLRGWVKTDAHGNYMIKTSRPAAYPNDSIPQHIHLSIKEPDLTKEYYADLYFDDDPLYLRHKKRYGKLDRAGTELLRIVLDDTVQIAEHNIVLGLHIPNYPKHLDKRVDSGLSIGDDQPSFMPYHFFGPDRGTRACPVCRYGRYHGLVYFVSEKSSLDEIKKWLVFLDQQSVIRKHYLKAYLVYVGSRRYSKDVSEKMLQEWGQMLRLQHVALTYVPSFNDEDTEMHRNKINPSVESTIVLFKHRTIVDKWINLKPSPENFDTVIQAIVNSKGNFFDLPEPRHE